MENYKPKEDSEFVKLTKIWVKALVCVLITIILTLGIYYGYRNYKIGEAIKKGHNPVVARLGFTCDSYGRLVYLNGNKNIQSQQISKSALKNLNKKESHHAK